MAQDLFIRSGDGPIVIFAHGFRTTAKEAFERVSKLVPPSMHLIVPAAKSSRDDALPYKNLADVLKGSPTDRPVIVLAHSGGYESVLAWLKSDTGKRIKAIGLLDALYAGVDAFGEFSRRGKLVTIGITEPPLSNSKKLKALPGVTVLTPTGLTHDGAHGLIPDLSRVLASIVSPRESSTVLKWLAGLGVGLVAWRLLRRRKRDAGVG